MSNIEIDDDASTIVGIDEDLNAQFIADSNEDLNEDLNANQDTIPDLIECDIEQSDLEDVQPTPHNQVYSNKYSSINQAWVIEHQNIIPEFIDSFK